MCIHIYMHPYIHAHVSTYDMHIPAYILYMVPSIYTYTHIHIYIYYKYVYTLNMHTYIDAQRQFLRRLGDGRSVRPASRGEWSLPPLLEKPTHPPQARSDVLCSWLHENSVTALDGTDRPWGHVAVNCCSESLPPGSTICRHNDTYQVAGKHVISLLESYHITGLTLFSILPIVLNSYKHNVRKLYRSDALIRCEGGPCSVGSVRKTERWSPVIGIRSFQLSRNRSSLTPEDGTRSTFRNVVFEKTLKAMENAQNYSRIYCCKPSSETFRLCYQISLFH
jgi:hypothetical protein